MEQDMIDQLTRSLRVPRGKRNAIGRELRTHLEEARRELVSSGWHPDEAVRECVTRLGEPAEIADAFSQLYKPSRRSQIGLALALATGMVLGVYGIGGSLASATTSHHPSPHIQNGHRIHSTSFKR
ncbi:MAG: hypothetical protein NVSMB52_11910 [Chloroflexota bacterium]